MTIDKLIESGIMTIDELFEKIDRNLIEADGGELLVIDRETLSRLIACARSLSCDGCGGTGLAQFSNAKRCMSCASARDYARGDK